jgi:hypothetical protein
MYILRTIEDVFPYINIRPALSIKFSDTNPPCGLYEEVSDQATQYWWPQIEYLLYLW